jgi:Flp pilus assembly protein TadG
LRVNSHEKGLVPFAPAICAKVMADTWGPLLRDAESQADMLSMRYSGAYKRPASRRRSGSVIVETCFVLIPLLAMLLATADFAVPIFLDSTFTHAVREGCRFGIAYQTSYNGTSYGSMTDAIKAVVQANSMGFLAGTSGLNKIAVKYYLPTSPYGEVTGTAGANANGNLLEVSVNGFNWTPMAPVGRLAQALSINVVAADRLESLGPGTTRPTP